MKTNYLCLIIYIDITIVPFITSQITHIADIMNYHVYRRVAMETVTILNLKFCQFNLKPLIKREARPEGLEPSTSNFGD
jgi:hypothetical protein